MRWLDRAVEEMAVNPVQVEIPTEESQVNHEELLSNVKASTFCGMVIQHLAVRANEVRGRRVVTRHDASTEP